MAAERDREIERICQAALELPRMQRETFLADACRDDDLRREVERLLAYEDAASAFLETPALAVTAQRMASRSQGLSAGQKLGVYTILSPLGSGGMGEVYRARDATLGREVAIKVLPTIFTTDPERLARFEREARVLASLNHPNIATIHGVEHVDGLHALILEVVEGQTLEARIGGPKGPPLPLPETLAIARQIAEALEAAHEKGIVHRDLKPANIKVRPDGVVKVLDFGLAKAIDGERASDLSHSPTLTVHRTGEGVLLGTAAYMSPEQARAKPVDKRADIWAFGCVLYEMLAGHAAFHGETVTDTLAAIVERDPSWSALPPTTPAPLQRLLRRCLDKDPKRRLHDIADARIEIEDALSGPANAADVGVPAPVRQTHQRLRWAVALLAVVATVTAGSLWYSSRFALVSRELRLEITTPPTTDPVSIAVSPDGRTLVFVATSEGKPQLWLRSFDAVSPRPLAGTLDAARPFWSPDSRSVGFSANGQLKRIDLDSGSVRVISAGGSSGGGTWNREGTVLFSNFPDGPLRRIPADGGDPIEILKPSLRVNNLQSPEFLPDGRHFLFHAEGTEPGVYIGELGASEPPKRLLDSPAVTYASSGHLLFVRQGTLFAQAIDPVRLEPTGVATTITERILVGSPAGAAALSASATGPIVYRAGSSMLPTQFVWFDRTGRALETVATGSDYGGLNSSLSPDAHLLATSRNVDGAASDIWLLDLNRGVPSRMTFDKAFDLTPVWSPDGRRIAFGSNRKGTFDPYVKPVSGAEDEQLLVADEEAGPPSDWSPDGRFILYARQRAPGRDDIWALRLDGDRRPFPVVETTFHEENAQFSPDGKWVAYQSNESGGVEIYVQPFPGPGPKTRISSQGGVQASWRYDGKELFYLAADGRLMAVPIRLDSDRMDVGTPVPLFAPLIGPINPRAPYARNYMVSRDGQRFLVNTIKEVTLPITVILNWKPKP